jgi:hypothetical protein
MRKHFAWMCLAFAATALQPTFSQAKEPRAKIDTQQFAPAESDLQEHGHYTNKSGKTVHSPAHTKSGAAPNGASAKCGDGSYSFSQSHRGTCSHHNGVLAWL